MTAAFPEHPAPLHSVSPLRSDCQQMSAHPARGTPGGYTVMVPVIPKVEFSIKPVDTGDVFSCVRFAQVRSAEMDHRAAFRRAHKISLPHPPIRSSPSGRLIWTHQNVGRRHSMNQSTGAISRPARRTTSTSFFYSRTHTRRHPRSGSDLGRRADQRGRPGDLADEEPRAGRHVDSFDSGGNVTGEDPDENRATVSRPVDTAVSIGQAAGRA